MGNIYTVLAFDAPNKLYLYPIQTGRGVVSWKGKRSKGEGGGVTTKTFCVMNL